MVTLTCLDSDPNALTQRSNYDHTRDLELALFLSPSVPHSDITIGGSTSVAQALLECRLAAAVVAAWCQWASGGHGCISTANSETSSVSHGG